MMLAAVVWALLNDSREVLCLYDSTEGRTPENNEIHLYAEVVLNHLGLVAVYRDVNEPLPSGVSRYRGVLTWFQDDRMERAAEYWRWIAGLPALGVKVVILGDLGAPPSAEALEALGLRYEGDETDDPTVLRVVHKDSYMDFERTLDGEFGSYARFAANGRSRVHLQVRRTDREERASDLVVTGPTGGFARVTLHYDPYVERAQWYLDPFAFFAEAFGLADVPRMDLTTAMGRRIFFAHIDGDGFANRVQQGPHAGRPAAELLRDEFLKKIDLPFTASVIAADLEDGADTARSIFELPNVEPAAHAFYHPEDWTKGTLSYPGTFDLGHEVVGAVRRIEEVTKRRVRVFLWTGHCNPPVEAIEMCDRLGLANLNGTDSFLDRRHDSYAHLRPVAIPRGDRLQFNARAVSENLYTSLWTKNFFAFRNVLETYRRTDAPRRVAPINLYFHYYVVEQPAGEAALREILAWVGEQEVYPMTVSEYVAWVRGFRSARIERLGTDDWRVRGYGACRTVRFDDAALFVDLEESRNVLGFRREGLTLYVHLASAPEARVRLTAMEPRGSYLVHANGEWRNGKIVSRTGAEALFRTSAGPLRVRGSDHVVEVKLP